MFTLFETPLSPNAAYCLGGIVSANEIKSCSDGQSAMLLPIRHNPKQVTSKQIRIHKKYIDEISATCNGSILSVNSKKFTSWFPKNKDGFLAVFYRDAIISYSNILTFATNNIINAPLPIKQAFLVGAFDGRCSWDKHAKKIVLDCSDSDGANLICKILNDFSIMYDYNLARDRKIGNTPRKPQLRITSYNVPDFMKKIGLISPAKIGTITKSSFGDALSTSDALLPGLTILLGLRHNMQSKKMSPPSKDTLKNSQLADEQLQRQIDITTLKRHKSKPQYNGVSREKEKVTSSNNKNETYPRKQRVSTNALEIADFKCEFDSTHRTFLRKRDSMPYTEPHHLVPLEYYNEFDVSLDVEENIVSLCSTCHNQLHYGEDIEVILEPLHNSRKSLLAKVGIVITYKELLKMYK